MFVLEESIDKLLMLTVQSNTCSHANYVTITTTRRALFSRVSRAVVQWEPNSKASQLVSAWFHFERWRHRKKKRKTRLPGFRLHAYKKKREYLGTRLVWNLATKVAKLFPVRLAAAAGCWAGGSWSSARCWGYTWSTGHTGTLTTGLVLA